MGEQALQDSINKVAANLNGEEPAPKPKREVKKVAKKVLKKKAKKADDEEKSTKKVKKAAKESNGADDEEGLVTVADLAAEAQISPQSARVKLRAAELDRGEGRWKWAEGSKGLKQARKILGIAE
jgi:outer membrane biosynthesis protein TonB